MIYAIPRYPAHLIDVITLPDGSRITIRPMLPQDVELQLRFFRSLSAEGRYRRFMTRFQELPKALIERFANIDYSNHVALLGEVFEDGKEIMIGEARYVIDRIDPATCEFAIAVSDEWRAHGIARALLDRLEREAAASGVTRMIADTLLSNQPMLGLAWRAGYVVTGNTKDPTLARLEKRLSAPKWRKAREAMG
jgi:GNAT superfamily N-acetyltransferase